MVSSPLVLNNLLSARAATIYSGYSLQYIRRLLRFGRLSGFKVGQLWFVEMNSLDDYLQRVNEEKDQRFGPKYNSHQCHS